MTNTKHGSLAVISAAVLWSLDGLLRRHLFHLPPTVIVYWEHTLGLLALLPFLVYYRKTFPSLSRTQWQAIILVSALSGVLGTVFYTAALGSIHFIPFSVVVLLQQTQPFFAIGSAHLWLKEPLPKRFIFIAILALISAFLVSFPHLTVYAPLNRETAIAALFALGAALCWGTSTTLSKYSLRDASFLHITGIRFGFTAVFACILTLFLGKVSSLAQVNLQDLRTLLAITCSTGLVALALYYFGLKRILASHSTLFELFWPLSAMLMGHFVFHEELTNTQWIGAIGLLGSIMHLSKNQKIPTEKIT
ncbi:DMT family transporter [Patescibacteria group bacterium]|nr:DMT family transporter [Patescibacteria group bacterium]MBP9709636.1 DMT family transporter [Patescibacteria group bacterium]